MPAALENPFLGGPRHWVYVDRDRTHEVHLELEPRGMRAEFVITEFPFGARDAAEMVQRRVPLEEPWEVKLEQAALETELALAGTYYRTSAGEGRWTPVRAPPPAAPVRLDAHVLPLPGAADAAATVAFHHFHHAKERRDRVLVSLPRVDLDAARFVLADLAFRFPEVDAGDLSILHPRLAPSTLRTALVRAHVELPRQGFGKLLDPVDYAAAFGGGWRERVRESFAGLARRLLDGRIGPGEAPPEREGPVVPVDLVRLRDAFADERLAAVRARHLDADTEARLVSQGELPIRRWVAQRRREARHDEQHVLSLLEAYLLTRYGMRANRRDLRDLEGAKLLRHLGGIL